MNDERWAKNEIDLFVRARLENEGLAPAEEASPFTICRRVTLDVTGLPPSAEEVVAFADDYRRRGDAALSDLIDRLMASQTWGEHRARYWLDVARYGDTHGLHFDNYREMWPYRDWVIRAFNANKPFDEFTIEQLAGDLLPSPTEDQLIATGLQRCNMTTNEGGTIPEENPRPLRGGSRADVRMGLPGLTTNCAPCHDHKYDPISTKDYYSLAAFFRNTTEPGLDKNAKEGGGATLVVPSEADRRRWEALPSEIEAVAAERAARRETATSDFTAWVERASSGEVRSLEAKDGLVFHSPLDRVEGPTIAAKAGAAAIASEPTANEVRWIAGGEHGPAPLLGDDASLEFAGVGDFDLHQPFSYGLWVRADYEEQRGHLLGRMAEGDLRHGWDLVAEDRRYMVHFIDDRTGSGLKVVTDSGLVRPGVWQHVFVTYDGSRAHTGVTIYVDGQPQTTAVWWNGLKDEASIRNEGDLRIGGPTTPKRRPTPPCRTPVSTTVSSALVR